MILLGKNVRIVSSRLVIPAKGGMTRKTDSVGATRINTRLKQRFSYHHQDEHRRQRPEGKIGQKKSWNQPLGDDERYRENSERHGCVMKDANKRFTERHSCFGCGAKPRAFLL